MIIINCFLGSVFSEWILTNKDVISTLSAFVTLISAVVAVRSDKTIQENKKTGKKHLSGFGVMTLIIIFLSCIVQYLVQYAQKSVDQLKTYNEDIEKRIQDSIFRERFVVQMYRFDSITNNFQVVNTRMKSQDSLDAMRFERNITRLKGLSQSVFDLYYDFKMSSETASENFKKTNIEQENIVKQQLNIAENINRTLNPFIPFGISFTINIKVNTNDTSNYHNESLLYARNNLLKAIERFDKKNKSPIPIFGGLTKMDSEGEPMYVINQDYKNMADFNFIECPIYLSFDIMSAAQRDSFGFLTQENLNYSSLGDFNAEFKIRNKPADSKENENIYSLKADHTDFQVYYYPQSDEFVFHVTSNEANYSYNKGTLKSIDDLQKCKMSMMIIGVPYEANIELFKFSMPPNYSREINVFSYLDTCYQTPYYTEIDTDFFVPYFNFYPDELKSKLMKTPALYYITYIDLMKLEDN